MTFGEQVDEAESHVILDRALARGVNFPDTAAIYAVPSREATFNATGIFNGNWLDKTPGAREKLVIAAKVAGPSRNMPRIRGGSADLTGLDITTACER